MKLVIRTQFYENYGAHNWDGEGECPQYWKPKGGSTFVFPGLDWMYAAAGTYKGLVERACNLVSYSNEYAEEYVIDWSFEEDDAVVADSWESIVQYRESVPNVFDAYQSVKPMNGSFNYGVEKLEESWVEIGMPGNEQSVREEYVRMVTHPDYGRVDERQVDYKKMRRDYRFKKLLELSKLGSIFSYCGYYNTVEMRVY